MRHRLNQAAPHLKIPIVDLDTDIGAVLEARMERLAPDSGSGELRGQPPPAGYHFWLADNRSDPAGRWWARPAGFWAGRCAVGGCQVLALSYASRISVEIRRAR